MKREILITFLLLILITPSILAVSLKVERVSQDDVMILGLGKPATFDLKITNLAGGGDSFTFYSFFGIETLPKGTIYLGSMETKEVQFGIYPRDDLKQRGWVNFEYFIKGSDGEQKEVMKTNILDLKDVFEVGSNEFDSSSSSIKVYIKNKVNFNFGEITAKFSSPFFNFEKTFTLDKKETQEFDVQLNKEDYKKLLAGFYTVKAEASVNGKETTSEGTIKFVEKNILTSKENRFGLIINTLTIKKINEGNVVAPTETIINKNIISRLFTNFNIEPDRVERKGLIVTYVWVEEVAPGDTLEITAKTNWILPFLIIVLIFIIIGLTKLYSRTSLVLKKRVSFVRAKGGEFALKVSILVQAKKFVERVNITDRLPPLVKLHERFGAEQPKRIDRGRIEWSFDKMESGETRILSYVIYSKVGVLGRFALPRTTAFYSREGKTHEAESNTAFFIAEQNRLVED
ncbi:MAG: hypothetical protein Q7S06_03400 [Nanoarchaeota archaeon]|nr:hypothetical protein [Nanoarchaeota archaeon]